MNNTSGYPSPPHFRKPLLDTPFHQRSREWSVNDNFVPWSGYSTVDVFTTVEQEYFAIRNTSTLFDLTPMVKYRIQGPDAEAYLNRLLTRDIRKLRIGRVAYVVWCNDDGHIVDDGTVFRMGNDDFRLCTAQRQLDWLLDSAIGFQVSVSEITEDVAALSMQGPTSFAILRQCGLQGLEKLKPFEFATFTSTNGDLMISRTGFTGDLGYEIWMEPGQAEAVWDQLIQTGKSRGIRPIGSQALNLARIEAGFLMPNVDFLSAEHTVRVHRDRTPLELGLSWLVDFDKPYFTGKKALARQHAAGVRKLLVGLDIQGNKAAHNAFLYASPKSQTECGFVTSAMWSPTCKRNIALALVDAPHFQEGTTLYVDLYLHRELLWERRMIQARVVQKPFFVHERRRLTPPADR